MARDRANRPEARPLRLFVAVDIPEALRRELSRAIAPVRERVSQARWVPSENWHVTLKFLGSTWPRLLDWVIEKVEETARAHVAFETHLTGMGAFPSARRARVLWAGLDDPDRRFAAMAGALEENLAREFRQETRPHTPHLTVARFDPPVPLEEDLVSAVALPVKAFKIDRLVLYRSYLRRPAPRYEPVREALLGTS